MKAKQKKNLTKTPLWNMSERKEVFDFIDDLQMTISNDQLLTAGLVLLLKEVENKESHIDAIDYLDDIIKYLFGTWVADGNKACRDYVKSLKARPVSDFVNE